MTKKVDRDQVYITEEAFEVRYEPRGSFLSEVGVIADYVRDKGLFPHWQIETNKIMFRDAPRQPEHLSAFMSYRNAGLIATDPPTRNFFSDKATQYWRTIQGNPHFKIPTISRIGVRNRCFARLDAEFVDIERAMFDFFCKPNVTKFLGGQRKDHQIVLISEDGETRTTSTFGPIHKGEATRLFEFSSEHFNHAGVFIDLDSFVESPARGIRAVDDFIKTASASAWERVEVLLDTIGL